VLSSNWLRFITPPGSLLRLRRSRAFKLAMIVESSVIKMQFKRHVPRSCSIFEFTAPGEARAEAGREINALKQPYAPFRSVRHPYWRLAF